ncbi:hypothetical protein [Agromyces cerinus]|uniref:Uncharacterized protein n=1 Tax=Agromyces cerinus subsp. cerinus TaxID=232089 RepID=A0A1N6FCB3_9MICO|nr:hypothetical protein [Agromyces cerinus]SIN92908.1 hypothetical protein SAMN05443544_1927 [Agromyces cerinus subsp. cerinus]
MQNPSLGSAPGQTALPQTAGTRPLGTTGSVLPELAEAPAQERKWWRHPAFMVSIGLTFVALASAITWFIITAVNDDSIAVSGLGLSIDGGNAHLDWSGPDAAYSVYAVHGDGETTDLTQWVTGTEAWLPSALGLYENDTCFVVRPTATTGEVSLDAATLGAQRAQSACVADATS